MMAPTALRRNVVTATTLLLNVILTQQLARTGPRRTRVEHIRRHRLATPELALHGTAELAIVGVG
ncbi:MAG TPA: hypothetical protein VK864_03270, partial [Longimicrobiales bacterium]|nr:hypothetical protein [Longimicrobiales bacterium]